MTDRVDLRSSHLRGRVRVLALLGLVVLTFAAIAAGARWHAAIERWFGAQSDVHRAEAPKQLWTCGMHPQVIQDHPGTCPICRMDLTPLDAGTSETGSAANEVAYWWDPMMDPPFVSDHAGKSPLGRDLVAVRTRDLSAGASVTVDPAIVQNMGVRLASVTEGPLARTIRVFGRLEEPEPNHVDVNLRVSGWIEKLEADTDGMPIEKGDPLFDLYSPELQIAIEDLIAARKSRDAAPAGDADARAMADAIYTSVAKKLELYGLAAADVESFARADHAPATVTFKSPMSGHLTEKSVVAGAAVKAGDRVMRIADRSTMWLDLSVFERDVPYVAVGTHVRASLESLPGKILEGDVSFIHPHLDPSTRTALARVVLKNHGHELREGMFATAEIDATVAERAILVPREAVIDTGERQIAFVSAQNGRFDPRRVTLGASGANGMVQILSGLAPGERVVTSGQFLLDAESRMREAIRRHVDQGLASAMSEPPKPASLSAPSEPVADAHEAPRGALDAVFAHYLDFARALGAVQAKDAPIDAGGLIQSARALADAASGSTRLLAAAVRDTAATLAGKSLDQQRETMKSLGVAMIALADHAPPSRSVADKLYVLRCTMAPGDWLQNVPDVENPFYGRAMKSCGDVLRTIDGAREER